MTYIAKTFHGLEEVLADELKELGASDIQVLRRAVKFDAPIAMMYKANLKLRTALRILKPIFRFEAFNERMLYEAIYDFDWMPHLKVNQTFAIDATVSSDRFRHSKYVALKTKDAIADQYRKRVRRRPSVDTDNPDVRINVHVFKTQFTISIDTSGDSLHKRGYRTRRHAAPLNEVLAAGMIKLSGWNADKVFVDPMCGSGTILMEAALMAKNIAPAPRTRKFAFQNGKDFQPILWKRLLEQAKDEEKEAEVEILGYDYDQYALDIAKEGIYKMRMEHQIKLQKRDFLRLNPPAEEGMIISNPPYGERIGSGDMDAFYGQIGDCLKQNWAGWEAWLISSNMKALKSVGLRPSKKIVLFNGALECKFQQYSMYQGSKKVKQAEE